MAKYYYYPGWWEGGPTLHTLINLAKWNELLRIEEAMGADATFAGVSAFAASVTAGLQ